MKSDNYVAAIFIQGDRDVELYKMATRLVASAKALGVEGVEVGKTGDGVYLGDTETGKYYEFAAFFEKCVEILGVKK